MHTLYERCCGLDVHKKTVVACILTPEHKQLKTFTTMTFDLLNLADWITEQGVTHVAMESSGVYWKPIYNLLEEFELEVLLVNARHIKAVPGRKSDVNDAQWIAELLQHGLLKASFVPQRPQRELRELVRFRRSIIQQKAQLSNRIQKILEGANIKLGNVASHVLGASGRAMLVALARGEDDPEVLASLAKGRLKAKHEQLAEALRGVVGEHQRFLLSSALRQLDFLEAEITQLDEEVARRLRPFQEAISRLDGIPGVGLRSAEEIVAEIGLDMEVFPTAKHLASWAKICPGLNQSAGKRMSGATGRGNKWLRSTLVEVAWAAGRTKNTYLSAQYRRLAVRRGKKRAAVAVAHSVLVIIYQLLRTGESYRDLGGNYFDERDQQATIRRAVRRIEHLGYRVTLEAT